MFKNAYRDSHVVIIVWIYYLFHLKQNKSKMNVSLFVNISVGFVLTFGMFSKRPLQKASIHIRIIYVGHVLSNSFKKVYPWLWYLYINYIFYMVVELGLYKRLTTYEGRVNVTTKSAVSANTPTSMAFFTNREVDWDARLI